MERFLVIRALLYSSPLLGGSFCPLLALDIPHFFGYTLENVFLENVFQRRKEEVEQQATVNEGGFL
jgi:hypothetical protein